MIEIILRLTALIIILVSIVPKSYREWKVAGDKLFPIPLLLMLFWVFSAAFILTNMFFVYFEVTFLGFFDSILLLVLSVLAMLMYRGNNISSMVHRRLKNDDKTIHK